MTGKGLGWTLIVVAGVMWYSGGQVTSGSIDATTTTGKIENQLAQINGLLGWPGNPIQLAYVLGAAGIWMVMR